QEEIDQARKDSPMHFGGIYLRPALQLKELGFDSNVFNQASDQSPDFTATLSPGADVALPLQRRALIAVHGDADLVYYLKYAGERSINPNVDGKVSVFLRRLTIFTAARYVNTHQRPNQEIDARARRTE